MTDSIRLLPLRLHVEELQKQLEQDVWDRHKVRTAQYVHSDIHDIWVRFNAWENYDGDLQKFNGSHESKWYPVVNEIPAVKPIVFDVMRFVEGEHLGGVLITKIPPGGSVKPHIDQGWHASTYEKFAVQVKGNQDQAFHFEDGSLSALDGEVYTFDNSKLHWVTNNSHSDRITLIICIRR